jgi:uncharacterized RDD family membrane protein YckC
MATPPLSPAGFWKRYVAYFIDLVLLYLLVELLSLLVFLALGGNELQHLLALLWRLADPQQMGADPLPALAELGQVAVRTSLVSGSAYLLLGGAYFVYHESSPRQATIGKRLVGIRVTDRHGARLTPARATARFAAAGLSWITLNLGHALAAWTPSRRALHDLVAGTQVVNADPAQAQMPLWGWAVVASHALMSLGMLFAVFAFAWALLQLGLVR